MAIDFSNPTGAGRYFADPVSAPTPETKRWGYSCGYIYERVDNVSYGRTIDHAQEHLSKLVHEIEELQQALRDHELDERNRLRQKRQAYLTEAQTHVLAGRRIAAVKALREASLCYGEDKCMSLLQAKELMETMETLLQVDRSSR